MGLYKEIDHYFAEQEKHQHQIYDDACDIGIPVDGIDDQLCVEVQEMLSGKGGWEGFCTGLKQHRTESRHQNGSLHYVSISMYLWWEQIEGTDDLHHCTKVTVTYTNDPIHRKKFITFMRQGTACTSADIWEGESGT